MRVSEFMGGAGDHSGAADTILAEVTAIVAETLGVDAESLTPDTPLLGHMIEMDSMAVVAIITELEHRYDFTVMDDELSSDVFDDVKSVARLVLEKLR